MAKKAFCELPASVFLPGNYLHNIITKSLCVHWVSELQFLLQHWVAQTTKQKNHDMGQSVIN